MHLKGNTAVLGASKEEGVAFSSPPLESIAEKRYDCVNGIIAIELTRV